ncbi:MAG TPA: hypothetical protein PK413_08795, partial [Thermoanaerobaculia bacterium]|nr:hypothetical protein [Thermoanaerobaculia bacterium]
MRLRESIFHILPALWLMASQPAFATIMRELSLDDLSQQSSLIIEGTCTGLRTSWQQGALMTEASFAVGDTFRGRSQETVRVLVAGGVDTSSSPAVAMQVVGAPTFYPGEHVLLFLRPLPAPDDAYAVVGLSQGK